MTGHDPKPVYGQILSFTFGCQCGYSANVGEDTDRSTFDPETGRFTCPKCLETVTLMLTLTPIEDEPGKTN
jgi:hypothetical protein